MGKFVDLRILSTYKCVPIAGGDNRYMETRRLKFVLGSLLNCQTLHTEAERKRQSQSVQRHLPRPSELNRNIVRPTTEQPLSDLQKAEDMVKHEMLRMLCNDAVNHPTADQAGKKGKASIASLRGELEANPLSKIADEEMQEARNLLAEEMTVVKNGMEHGDLSLEAYSTVWDECYDQVMFIPSQNRITRAAMASKKDRLESLEKKLDRNRGHMMKDAKRAAKMEKKLKVLMGGYQARALGLSKQMADIHDQVEQTFVEMKTFEALRIQELQSIPRRLESLNEAVTRQSERERELQYRFSRLIVERDIIFSGNEQLTATVLV
ncbi:cell division cycle 5-related protein-like [Corticium candelabrum]|uniref:cell division cycle 5-related protein-like n=1 Tax=Corticium candelabrum TaxID=121492 RepID=UPI002E25AA7C|nr:cell division cycle 5-related protein-like [Corticium candelabrum]